MHPLISASLINAVYLATTVIFYVQLYSIAIATAIGMWKSILISYFCIFIN